MLSRETGAKAASTREASTVSPSRKSLAMVENASSPARRRRWTAVSPGAAESSPTPNVVFDALGGEVSAFEHSAQVCQRLPVGDRRC